MSASLAIVFLLGGLGLTLLSIYFLRNLKKEEQQQKERKKEQ